jgi:hypothetical protein
MLSKQIEEFNLNQKMKLEILFREISEENQNWLVRMKKQF